MKTVQRGLNTTINRVISMTSELLFGTKRSSVSENSFLSNLKIDLDRLDLCEIRKRVEAPKYSVGTLLLESQEYFQLVTVQNYIQSSGNPSKLWLFYRINDLK